MILARAIAVYLWYTGAKVKKTQEPNQLPRTTKYPNLFLDLARYSICYPFYKYTVGDRKSDSFDINLRTLIPLNINLGGFCQVLASFDDICSVHNLQSSFGLSSQCQNSHFVHPLLCCSLWHITQILIFSA